MAIKSGSIEPKTFIPSSEVGEEYPTIFHFTPLTKAGHDKWQDAMVESSKKSKKFSVTTEKADRALINETVFKIENIYIKDKFIEEITDKEQISDFIMGLNDIDIANNLLKVIRGESLLDEDEEKN